jgi:hypothetical protein
VSRRLVTALALLALVAAGCGDGSEGAGPPPGRFIATSRSLTPTAHLFADPVAVRIDVVVSRKRLDPERVRLRVAFLPYRIVGGISRSRQDFHRFTRLTYRMQLRCLTIQCVPSRLGSVLGGQEGRGERRTFRFKPARLLYDDPRTGELRHLRRLWWPPLDSISRLSAVDPAARTSGSFPLGPGAEFQSTLVPVPEPSYRLSPPLLGGLLLAGAAALLALPTGLTARSVRRRRREQAEREQAGLSPLERALARLERANEAGTDEETREALEGLASVLDASGLGRRATDVRELAWSSAPPAAAAVAEVLQSARECDDAAA